MPDLQRNVFLAATSQRRTQLPECYATPAHPHDYEPDSASQQLSQAGVSVRIEPRPICDLQKAY